MQSSVFIGLKVKTHKHTPKHICWLNPFYVNKRIQCIQTHTQPEAGQTSSQRYHEAERQEKSNLIG
ncbi:hypothetical protein EXN66_Car019944 [Channa argus]|uniref:Uncharacterized protein n=1 Tax=Channa argus TaxID=215402 RepID=A0A6G1QNX7_CHAAH|nr:hypothetical protein EXN66_Car019944 [Channa argus]